MTGPTGLQFEIENSNRFGPLNLNRLAAFESTLGCRLPEDYRNFLIDHNGANPKGTGKTAMLHHVCGLHDGPSWAQFRPGNGVIAKLLPARMLPFADDAFGNLHCLSLEAPDRGSVFFWDHENAKPDSLRFESPDFSSFLEGVAWFVALRNNDATAVYDAIARRMDLNRPILGEDRLVDLALQYSGIEILRLLIAAGAKIGEDAAIHGARRGKLEVMQLVVEGGADINYKVPVTNFTPLMLACSSGEMEVAELLLSKGADRSVINKWGKTALDLARSEQLKELLRSYS